MKSRLFISGCVVLILMCVGAACATDLNALYASDYDLFWKEWNKLQVKAVSCTDYSLTAKFLTNALETGGNAEVAEANADVIEGLALKNTECLLAALVQIKNEAQRQIIRFFIVTPTYNKASVIKGALAKCWERAKYRQIKEIYEDICQRGAALDRRESAHASQ